MGLLLGVELKEAAAGIVTKAQEKGLLILTAGPNVLRLLPALTIPEEDLIAGLDLLASILAEEAARVGGGTRA